MNDFVWQKVFIVDYFVEDFPKVIWVKIKLVEKILWIVNVSILLFCKSILIIAYQFGTSKKFSMKFWVKYLGIKCLIIF